jgi:cytochrome c-type biogenesis protein CcmF
LLFNNLVMTTAAAAVLLGTLYPLFLDAINAGKVSVGAPFFNAVFIPLMAPMIAAMAVGPLLAWKRGDLAPAFKRLWFAFAATAATVAVSWSAMTGGPLIGVVGTALAVWLFVGTLVEFAERVKFPRAPLGETFSRLMRLPRAGWGMTLAHAGLAIAIAGMAGTAWKVEKIQVMKPGDTVAIRPYSFAFEGARAITGPNYTGTRGTFTVRHAGKPFVVLEPEKRVYNVQGMPTTEAAIHPTFWGDLYVVIGDAEGSAGAYVTRLYFNPLMSWLWAGVCVMVFGGFLSISDRRYRVGAPAGRRTALGTAAAKA